MRIGQVLGGGAQRQARAAGAGHPRELAVRDLQRVHARRDGASHSLRVGQERQRDALPHVARHHHRHGGDDQGEQRRIVK
eukprot:2586456-Pyramimonas_sp.AAC.1